MPNYFSEVQVINLGSRYIGWKEDVEELLREIDNRPILRQSAPGVPITYMIQRLRQLKYVCLVPRLMIDETRVIFREASGLLKHKGNYNEIEDGFGGFNDRNIRGKINGEMDDDPFLEEMLNKMEDAPWDVEDDWESWDSYDNEYQEQSRLLWECFETAGKEPFYGIHNESQTISVTVDCYGMYVPSFYNWLKNIVKQISFPPIVEWYDRLSKDPSLDGPAVLLCPELIETIHPLVVYKSGNPVRQMLCLKNNPDRVFLKMVLLHEIGHHIYTCPTKNLSEAMANWFVYGFLSHEERILMHIKTKTQRKPYRMYQGILSLLYPNQFSTPWPSVAFPWPIPTGEEYVFALGRAAFDGRLTPGVDLNQHPWNKLLEWLDISGAFWENIFNIHHRFFSRRAKPWDMLYHPVQFYGYKILREILWPEGDRVSNSLRGLENLVSYINPKGFAPMGKRAQQCWLDEMFRKNRQID